MAYVHKNALPLISIKTTEQENSVFSYWAAHRENRLRTLRLDECDILEQFKLLLADVLYNKCSVVFLICLSMSNETTECLL